MCIMLEWSVPRCSLQAGFDGPFLIELTMLRLLVTIYQVRRAATQPACKPRSDRSNPDQRWF
jgi:hypothetical protein